MYICYVVPFFTNKAVCMLYVCVSSDMFVFAPILVNFCLSGLVYLYYVFLVL